AQAKAGAITAYIGFDCTAASLHVGSLLPIMMLYWLQQTGHRPIARMGGGTTRVGDPSGKDESRRILSDEDINENLKGIRAVYSNFLTFQSGLTKRIKRAPNEHPPHPGALDRPLKKIAQALMANNARWLNRLNYIDFLCLVVRHFSFNRH